MTLAHEASGRHPICSTVGKAGTCRDMRCYAQYAKNNIIDDVWLADNMDG